MRFDAFRSAWMVRLSPNADNPLTAGDMAALVGIVGRLTRIQISNHEVEAQHLAFEAMQACRMGRRAYNFEIPFRPLRRDLGLREDKDLVTALERLRGVRIGSRPAFDGLDYDRAQDTLTVALAPGRQIVSAHPGFDTVSRNLDRRGLVHMSTQKLAAMRVVHSVPIIARLSAWHLRGYEHGLRLYRMQRYDEAMTVTIPIDLVPRALGLVNVTSFRIADFKRVEKRIIEDARSVGLRVTFKVEYAGRSPTQLGIAVVDEDMENDQEYVRPERPPMPTAKREALPEAVAETVEEVVDNDPHSEARKAWEAAKAAASERTNVVAFAAYRDPGVADLWGAHLRDETVESPVDAPKNIESGSPPQSEPMVGDEIEAIFGPAPDDRHAVDEHGRPGLKWWGDEPFWPNGLSFIDRAVIPLTLPYRHGDFAFDQPFGTFPSNVECRYWRPSPVTSMADFRDRVMVCWEMAEDMRKQSEQSDYDDELGIDRDAEDGYVEPSDADAWDQPPPRSYDDEDEDGDEGYNTHVDVD